MLVKLDEREFYSLYKAWYAEKAQKGVILSENCINCIFEYYTEIYYGEVFEINFNDIFMGINIRNGETLVFDYGYLFEGFTFKDLDIAVDLDEDFHITEYLHGGDVGDISDEILELLVEKLSENNMVCTFNDYVFDKELDKYVDETFYIVWD